MGRIKDLLLRLQNEQDQPNPNEIKLSFSDQWFLLTTMLGFIKHSKYSPKRKIRLIKLFDILYLASTKGSTIKFNKIIANTKK
tara:strand:+ start:697 stop:945 length:249 start_codon:yes stop_codon:yes gene_type:complete